MRSTGSVVGSESSSFCIIEFRDLAESIDEISSPRSLVDRVHVIMALLSEQRSRESLRGGGTADVEQIMRANGEGRRFPAPSFVIPQAGHFQLTLILPVCRYSKKYETVKLEDDIKSLVSQRGK